MLDRFARLRGRAKAAVAVGLVVTLVILVTGVTAILAPSRAIAAQSTLTVLTGTVEVRAADSGSFSASRDGAFLESGATVRTSNDGNAVITFFDGSTVTLEPNSELTLEKLEARGNGDTIISLIQSVGYSWHVVAKKLTQGSQYQVRTPSATASVRGTAFELEVDNEGKTKQTTHEGSVANKGQQGDEVVTPPGKQIEVAPNSPPSTPTDAPEPPATVKVTIETNNTQSAAAVDAQGRSVGSVGGQPVRYAPGSKVETTSDGKMVISIPQKQPGRVSTVVKTDTPSQSVQINTQVESKGTIVSNTVEVRKPDENGIAKGGIATTSNGVLVLPDSEAKKFTAPDIGQIPTVNTGGFFGGNIAIPTPITGIRGQGGASGAPVQTGGAFLFPSGVTLPVDTQTGEFKGGFQAFGNFGTAGSTGGPGASPGVGVQGQGGGSAGQANAGLIDFSKLTTEQLSFISQLIPTAPPGASDTSKVPGFGSSAGQGVPIGTGAFPGQGGPVSTGFPGQAPTQTGFPGQGVPFSTGGPGAPGGQGGVPFSSAFPFPSGATGAQGQNPFGVGPSPFTTGQSPFGGQTTGGQQGSLPEGCSQTIFGVTCSGASGPTTTQPTGGPGASPGTFPGGGATGGSFPPGLSFPPGASFPPGQGTQSFVPGQGVQSFPPGASFPPGQGTQSFVPGPALQSFPPTQSFIPTQSFVPTTGGLTPPPGVSFPTATFSPTGPTTCVPPQVLLPDGKCGTPPSGPTPAPIITGPTPAPIITGPTPAPIPPPSGPTPP